jgi:hypothetical protein
MSSKTKDGLPEMNVDSGRLFELARDLVATHADLATIETSEKKQKQEIVQVASATRTSEESKGSYIGLIRIVLGDSAPVQVQFKIQNGALDVTEEANLDGLFGPGRPLLFERDHVVTEIVDPAALIDELKQQGKNPWDYLDVKVKPDLDRAVYQSKHVVAAEAFLPKKGFLAKLNEIGHTLSDEAKAYITTYLEKCLRPVVSVGSKG